MSSSFANHNTTFFIRHMVVSVTFTHTWLIVLYNCVTLVLSPCVAAIICSSPVVPDQRHEPNVSLTPAKGILSQVCPPTFSYSVHTAIVDNIWRSTYTLCVRVAVNLRRADYDALTYLWWWGPNTYCIKHCRRESCRNFVSRSQPSSLQLSEVERYLQEELETMRRAFQIRLGQLEKRYQRQLWMAQQRNSTAMSVSEDVSIRLARTGGTSQQRRSSWHSCLSDSDYEDLESGHVQQRCGSSQGFDSDCNVESDDDAFDQSDERIRSHDQRDNHMMHEYWGSRVQKQVQRSQSLAVNHTSPPRTQEGLKGGTRMWNVEPGNGARAGSVVQEEVDSGTLPPRAKALVNERVSEHRERILRYFQQVRMSL